MIGLRVFDVGILPVKSQSFLNRYREGKPEMLDPQRGE